MCSLPDTVGLIGVAIILIAYFLMYIEKIKADCLSYYLFNAIGSLLIIYSLLHAWNLSAWIMEVCWLVISLAGIWKSFSKGKTSCQTE